MAHGKGMTITEYALSNVTLFQLDFLVAIVGFTAVRYYLPNYMLGKQSTLRTGMVLAFCYALFGAIRGSVIDAKNAHDATGEERKRRRRRPGAGYYYDK